jgi:Ca2+-binding EF-hand superfamily protein
MRKWAFLTMALACVSFGAAATQAADAPKKDPEEVFKKLDKDGDGKLTLAEFVGKKEGDKLTAAEAQFKAKDKDSDGFLTLDEFKAKVKKNQ